MSVNNYLVTEFLCFSKFTGSIYRPQYPTVDSLLW